MLAHAQLFLLVPFDHQEAVDGPHEPVQLRRVDLVPRREPLERARAVFVVGVEPERLEQTVVGLLLVAEPLEEHRRDAP